MELLIRVGRFELQVRFDTAILWIVLQILWWVFNQPPSGVA